MMMPSKKTRVSDGLTIKKVKVIPALSNEAVSLNPATVVSSTVVPNTKSGYIKQFVTLPKSLEPVHRPQSLMTSKNTNQSNKKTSPETTHTEKIPAYETEGQISHASQRIHIIILNMIHNAKL